MSRIISLGSSKAESEPSAFEFLSGTYCNYTVLESSHNVMKTYTCTCIASCILAVMQFKPTFRFSIGHGSVMYMYVSVADTTTGGPSSGGEDGGDEGIQEGTSREGRGGEEEKSAFSFISREPPELPEESQESGFSFLCSVDPPHGGGESEEKKEGAHVSEHVDSSQTSQEAPPLSTNSSPPIMTPKPAMASARLRDTNTSFQTSSGAVSPVPGPISPPLTSHPTSGATSKPSEGGRTHVGKQQPSANKKKKKKRKITR